MIPKFNVEIDTIFFIDIKGRQGCQRVNCINYYLRCIDKNVKLRMKILSLKPNMNEDNVGNIVIDAKGIKTI